MPRGELAGWQWGSENVLAGSRPPQGLPALIHSAGCAGLSRLAGREHVGSLYQDCQRGRHRVCSYPSEWGGRGSRPGGGPGWGLLCPSALIPSTGQVCSHHLGTVLPAPSQGGEASGRGHICLLLSGRPQEGLFLLDGRAPPWDPAQPSPQAPSGQAEKGPDHPGPPSVIQCTHLLQAYGEGRNRTGRVSPGEETRPKDLISPSFL